MIRFRSPADRARPVSVPWQDFPRAGMSSVPCLQLSSPYTPEEETECDIQSASLKLLIAPRALKIEAAGGVQKPWAKLF